MTAQLHNFLTAVLPTAGNYAVVHSDGIDPHNPKKQKIKQLKRSSLLAVEDFCLLNRYNSQDCWFGLATYKQGWHKVQTPKGEKWRFRTQDNAFAVKSLWLDVDVGDTKDYPTRESAGDAIATFVTELGLPRPWVIGSGATGLHIYWAFTQDIEVHRWQWVANRLHQATKTKGLMVDPARTRDVASIMRCPLTWNMKGSAEGIPPTQVHILLEGELIAYEDMVTILEPFEPVAEDTPLTLHLSELDLPVIPNITVDTNSIMGKYFSPIITTYPKANPLDVLAGCEQMRWKDGGPEPVWRGVLATLRHCTNGEHVAHKVSAQDKRYDTAITDEKLSYLETNGIAPYRCETFQDLRPEVCNRCPHRGLIKSPISAPKRIPTVTIAEPQDVTPIENNDPLTGVDSTVGGSSPIPELPPIPEIKTTNFSVNASGCWARRKNGDGEWYWTHIYEHPVYPIQRIKDRSSKGDVQISYVFRKHSAKGHDDFQMTGEVLLGQGLNSFLGSVGFLLQDKDRKAMAGLLIDILKECEHTLAETKMSDRLGWDDDQKAFLLGNKLYKTNGDVLAISPKGKASEYSQYTVPRGTVDQWKRIANVYNKKGLEWGQAAVASAFASPLMPIGALEKAALMFITGEKGVGKSVALSLSMSVYGNPARLMINKDDTYLARLHKLGTMNNISAAFDEMTDLTPKEASELAYQITQGRGKDKMEQGGKDMVHNSTYWSCLPVMSANDSMITALSQHSADPTAQMSRVLEIKATDINSVYTAEEYIQCEKLVRTLPQNYGVAGDLYIRYITSNLDEVNDMLYQIEKRFIAKTGLTSTYRFWSYMCTRMIVGMMIAKKLGLVNYDIANFFLYLVDLVIHAKEDIDKYRWSPDTLFPQFLSQHLPNRLVVISPRRPKGMHDDMTRGALNDINYVVQTPSNGREIVLRVELSHERCLISIPSVRAWCKRNGASYNEFINVMQRDYNVTSLKTRHDLGKNTVYRGNGVVDCIAVKLPKSMFIDDEEDTNVTEK